MTKEIVRELVDGEWVTGVRDASSGGGGGMFPNGAVDAAWDGSPVTALDGQLVSVDANGGAVTVTLPSDPPQGSVVGVQLVTDPNGNTVTVDGNGDAIQGSSTYDLPSLAQYETALFTYATGITEAWTVFVKPSAGGGSSTEREHFTGNNVLVGSNTAYTALTFDTKVDGDDLLDNSTPDSPTVIAAGVYAVTIALTPTDNMTVGAGYSAALDLDRDGANATEPIITAAPATVLNPTPTLSLAATYYIPAGGVIGVTVLNQDSGSINFRIDQAAIQRLS